MNGLSLSRAGRRESRASLLRPAVSSPAAGKAGALAGDVVGGLGHRFGVQDIAVGVEEEDIPGQAERMRPLIFEPMFQKTAVHAA